MRLLLNWASNMVPKLSVVMPCFNESVSNLDQSFSSLKSQIFSNFECFVIDESTDINSASHCKALCDSDVRFSYVKPQTRLGLAASLNLGISLATSAWIARFDSDDICLPERFKVQMDYLAENPRIGVLGGALEIIDGHGRKVGQRSYPLNHDAIVNAFFFTTPIAHPTVLFKKELIVKESGYRPEFKSSEDLDLWLRLLNAGVVFGNVEKSVVKYRQAETKRSKTHWKFNLKARVDNFKFNGFWKRVFGIFIIGAWSCIPDVLQEPLYKMIIFKSNSSNEA